MPKYFDIKPAKETKKTPPVKKKADNMGLILLAILIFVLVMFLTKLLPKNYMENASIDLENKIDSSSLQIFNQPKNTKVRIINASDKTDAIEKNKEIVGQNNFAIEQTSSTDEKYTQTTIYYKPNQKENAQNLGLILENNLKPKLEESQTLGQTYDILLVIGQE